MPEGGRCSTVPCGGIFNTGANAWRLFMYHRLSLSVCLTVSVSLYVSMYPSLCMSHCLRLFLSHLLTPSLSFYFTVLALARFYFVFLLAHFQSYSSSDILTRPTLLYSVLFLMYLSSSVSLSQPGSLFLSIYEVTLGQNNELQVTWLKSVSSSAQTHI